MGEVSSVSSLFTWIDWFVVGLYLVATTWVGHVMSGKQATIKDFFLGGRSLPWWAVSGSIIATEISGVTFIGVPGMLFALNGDMTYLQWGIGSILARFIIGFYVVKVYYAREIYSPYDYFGERLGAGAKRLATVLFSVGSILGQSVRVLVAAIPLHLATNLSLEWCILIIGLVAVAWTLMGGMQTVIWTDVMQFGLFVFGGLFALFSLFSQIDGGFSEIWAIGEEFGRTRLFSFEMEAHLKFTFWVAVFAVPFQNLTAFGVDQLNAQRMFCCKNASDAGKALVFSSVGQVLTLMMMLVGVSLFAYYHQHPMTEVERALVHAKDTFVGGSQVPAIGKPDNVFPMWIVSQLPVGISGLILAGVFAAAISSLDSILAALSQTTLSVLYSPENKSEEELSQLNLLNKSRLLVLFWGVLLTGFTLIMKVLYDLGTPILPMAFGVTAYTVGPLLAMLVVSLMGKGSLRGLIVGTVLSLILTSFVRTDIWLLLDEVGIETAWRAVLPTFDWSDPTTGSGQLIPTFSFVWMWPVTTFICVLTALFIPASFQKTKG